MGAQLIGVVGPSGVGKDTVMHALAAKVQDLRRVQRVITRPAGVGSENSQSVSIEKFEQRVKAGAFCLWWEAHGLFYGIPHAQVERRQNGEVALVNLSRGVLDQARAQFLDFRVLSLTAQDTTLAHRLVGRGRESGAEIAKRLARASYVRPIGGDVIEISNDGDIKDTVDATIAAFCLERAEQST